MAKRRRKTGRKKKRGSKPDFVPTKKQIENAKKEIQSTWTEKEFWLRHWMNRVDGADLLRECSDPLEM